MGDGQYTRTGQLYTFLGFAVFDLIPANYQGPPPPPPPPVQYSRSIYVVWDIPPVSGPTFYDFFDLPNGSTQNLDNQCGNVVGGPNPLSEIHDPTTNGRGANPSTRIPPGDLGSIGFSNNCHYVENTLGSAQLKCDNNVSVDCHPPDANLANAVTPNNGACGGIQNVRMLVMVR